MTRTWDLGYIDAAKSGAAMIHDGAGEQAMLAMAIMAEADPSGVSGPRGIIRSTMSVPGRERIGAMEPAHGVGV